jgi:CubicO group peptidase (beta-lactamase class C family)
MHRREFLHQSIRTALAIGAGIPSLTAAGQHRFADNLLTGQDINAIVAAIETLMPGLIREANVPGLSITLVNEGKRVWSRGFGVCDASTDKPVNADTVFEIASVSKTVFAYWVMKLCEQGVMALDIPLVKYWPQLPLAMGLESDTRASQITARHILSHQSGLQNWRTPEEPLKIHFDPGKGFMYSGEGYYYLQSVVTHLRGKVDKTHCGSYEADHQVCATDIGAYLEQQLIIPMEMHSSGYVPTEKIHSNYALPHGVNGQVISKPSQTATDLARYAAAGGVLSTANDYAKFIISQFSPQENDPYRLNKKSLEEMHKPQVKLPSDQKIDGATAWALGWAVQERPEGDVLVHSGGQSGYKSLAMVSVQRRSGFVMLTNSDYGGYVLYNEKLGKILNQLLPA